MLSTSSRYPNCTACTFSSFCVPEEKTPSSTKNKNLVVRHRQQLKRKEAICAPHNKFQNLYVVQQGALKTYHVEADGKELIHGFYFAGEVFGYEAIHTGYYPFSAAAILGSVICQVPYQEFLETLDSKPEFQKEILSLMSQQLNRGSYLASTTAKQRLAAFLIDLSRRLHRPHIYSEFLLPMSHQDMGNYLKLTPETISRLLSQFQKNGIIQVDHKKISFLQLDKLKQIADGLDE